MDDLMSKRVKDGKRPGLRPGVTARGRGRTAEAPVEGGRTAIGLPRPMTNGRSPGRGLPWPGTDGGSPGREGGRTAKSLQKTGTDCVSPSHPSGSRGLTARGILRPGTDVWGSLRRVRTARSSPVSGVSPGGRPLRMAKDVPRPQPSEILNREHRKTWTP